MEFWDGIIHTAILGTDKKVLKKEDLPTALAAEYNLLTQNRDKEEQYLQLASAAAAYRKCGALPLQKTAEVIAAQEETKPYCNAPAQQALGDILSAESYPLLTLWLEECNRKSQLVQPDMIPVLFDVAKKQKHLRESIIVTTGKRGEWLLPMNADWDFGLPGNEETLWQTGTLEERKMYLQIQRQQDALKGRALLQETWAQESANTKAELLKQLSFGLENEDTKWLESLLTEKSSKVKDEVIQLLKRLPNSSFVQQYWNVVKDAIDIRKEKGLLGIGRKMKLTIHLPVIKEAIFQTGIEKVSSNRKESDDDFVLHQLISAVPPSFFETHFELSREEICDVFYHSKNGKPLFSAFGLAAARFKELDWLRTVIDKTEGQLYPEALELLPDEEKFSYATRFIKDSTAADTLIHYLQIYPQQPWSLALTKEIFRHTAKNSYRYPQSFYKDNILRFPIDIMNELETCAPPDEWARNQWNKMSDYIIRLLTLRRQIVQAFEL